MNDNNFPPEENEEDSFDYVEGTDHIYMKRTGCFFKGHMIYLSMVVEAQYEKDF